MLNEIVSIVALVVAGGSGARIILMVGRYIGTLEKILTEVKEDGARTTAAVKLIDQRVTALEKSGKLP